MKMKCLAILIIIPLLMLSCEKEPSSYTSIKGMETRIFLSIKAYRIDNGQDGPFVHQFIMVRESQIYSYKMASGVDNLGTQGLPEHWTAVHEKIGGYNDQALVLSTQSSDEDEILIQLLQLPDADSILLEDLTQCGIGVESDSEGNNYITVMLMKVDS